MKCRACMVELKRTAQTKRLEEIELPHRLFYEYAVAEYNEIRDLFQKIQPQSSLDVGCGPGTHIDIAINQGVEEIVGLDANEGIIDYLRRNYKDPSQVEIIHEKIEDSLSFEDNHFDLIINSMNIVGWQDDEYKWLSEMLRCGKTVYLSVYKAGFEDEREEIYKGRGHKSIGFKCDNINWREHKNIIIEDCELGECISKSYTKEELEEILRMLPADYEIKDLSTLAYSYVLRKAPPQYENLDDAAISALNELESTGKRDLKKDNSKYFSNLLKRLFTWREGLEEGKYKIRQFEKQGKTWKEVHSETDWNYSKSFIDTPFPGLKLEFSPTDYEQRYVEENFHVWLGVQYSVTNQGLIIYGRDHIHDPVTARAYLKK